MVKRLLLNLIPGMRAHERLRWRLIGGDVPQDSPPHLARLLAFAKEHNPYYCALLKDDPEWSAIPPLTKALIRENFGQLRSVVAASPTFLNSSGGSTGVPQTIVQDLEYDLWGRAAESYYYQAFLGVDQNEAKKVVLWGSERDLERQRDFKGKAALWLTNTTFLNTFRRNGDAEREVFVEIINRIKPHFVKGYAAALYELAKAAKRRKLRVFSPRFVYSSAQTLEDYMRREIEDVFGAKVHDFYGSREVGPIAGECKSGRRHIFSFNNLVEVVDEASRPLSRGTGRILVTTLHNYSMPLIRYDIGDMGALGEGSCPCGSRLPWLEKIEGRHTDHLITKDRRLVSGGYFTHLFFFRQWVRQFQISQLDYDLVRIAVVKEPSVDPAQADMREIEAKIRLALGEGCRISWAFVEAIPPTPQGKRIYSRCLIPRP